jgi:hypothetical protein
VDHDESAKSWPARDRAWRIRLRRLPLELGTVSEAIRHQRTTTLVLSAVTAAIGLGITTLIAAFGRWDFGLLAGLALPGLIILMAWLDYSRLEREARRYEAEKREAESSHRS